MSDHAVAQPKKPGKVIRVSPTVERFILSRRKPKETIDALIRRLIGLGPKRGGRAAETFWLLPSSLQGFRDLAEARGQAILASVRTKKKPEQPIEVREVL